VPTFLNYNINGEGLSIGDLSSPVVGSVSAYMNVHVQEARNESLASGEIPVIFFGFRFGDYNYALPDGSNPVKSEDLGYSETSSASGLVTRFSKSMSYSSQASAIQTPPTSVGFTPSFPF
jgi:hypothetical protein